MSNPKIPRKLLYAQHRAMLKIAGTDFFSHNLKLHCSLCGHRILIRSLLRRNWRWTACPSSEGYTNYMTHPDRLKEAGECESI